MSDDRAVPGPGAAFPPALQTQLDAELAAGNGGQPPRTRHRDGARPHFTNRLILESSPYLRQHAHNPVNWYPWGDEAFDEAARSGRPVFLSIGYSTCHWCHVMEEESFEDVEIARLLNEQYVAIKVDREERPDVDTVYMTAVQALTRHGGWPMSVWLDAARRPYFAGTYFPARDGDRGAHRGFDSLLRELADIYRGDSQRVAAAATSITAAIEAAMAQGRAADVLPGEDILDAAVHFYKRAYDPDYGGFRGAPKFPSSLPVRFLLRRYDRTGDAALLTMAEHTLEMMAAGGMHDQLAGGFHRYSTDERWLVPHFEKMLYDNALLAVAYAEAWQVTGRADFARVVRTTLDYVLREMTAPGGGFYSATDADSQGEEGTFFVWREPEIRAVLGPQAERFIGFYGVSEWGNFEGKSVLFVPHPDEPQWEALAAARERLRVAREARPRPLRDEKILAAWNGLMISALAIGGRVLGEPHYVAAAARAATFMLRELRRDGRIQRSWRDGRVSGPGFLDDDACVVAGLLDLYEATFERDWLVQALALATGTDRLFGDPDHGGWFRSAADHEELIAREKPMHDGAEPSGASVALRNVLRLHALTGDDRRRRQAEAALRVYAPLLAEQPGALGEMLLAVDAFTDTPLEIVLIWPRRDAPDPFADVLRRTFIPNRALLGAVEGERDALAAFAPIVAGKATISGTPTAYVCRQGTCRLPATEASALLERITELRTVVSPPSD